MGKICHAEASPPRCAPLRSHSCTQTGGNWGGWGTSTDSALPTLTHQLVYQACIAITPHSKQKITRTLCCSRPPKQHRAGTGAALLEARAQPPARSPQPVLLPISPGCAPAPALHCAESWDAPELCLSRWRTPSVQKIISFQLNYVCHRAYSSAPKTMLTGKQLLKLSLEKPIHF